MYVLVFGFFLLGNNSSRISWGRMFFQYISIQMIAGVASMCPNHGDTNYPCAKQTKPVTITRSLPMPVWIRSPDTI